MRNILPFLGLAIAFPACAAEPVRLIVSGTHVEPSSGRVTVDLVAINASGATADFTSPGTITASLKSANGRSDTITLHPAAPADHKPIAASGFIPLRYEGTLPVGTGPGMLSLSVPDAPIIALDIPAGASAAEPVQVATATTETPSPPAAATQPVTTPPAAPPSAGSPRDNPLLPNLSVYEPIYFVYGPGTNTAARIQLSLKYRLFGQRGNWMDGINFAYTQRMFWDIGGVSSPFRDVNYMPELFYLVPPKPVGSNGLSIGGRFGARHESNGRDGLASRTLNTVYVQPEASLPIGRYTLTLGPRVWAYVGGQAGNEDIERYRGHTGLYAAFGEDDGLRLSLTSRFAFGSGKGAVDGTLSYPLTKMWSSGPQLYMIAQGFAGYGESLLDYNRKQTRLRIGFGITR
ncbi:phospholipase [Sphingomonas sp. AP4-R1]|uniref:phospholipase A n=1 Tax=Sphingomonas sp. AP4-R1 TaxID=2735134 RepID=UPI001493BC20|nr:phospholipase A [Sphingomonas sp. AP4-R1]QJU59530.1 phospholipase [Sphingomonas sp. AP4-R1]